MPLSNPNTPDPIRPRPFGSTSTCILADDLTGACDAASAFASCNLPTEVRLLPDLEPVPSDIPNSVLAVSTATRDIPSTEAIAAIEALGQNPHLQQIPNLFKKIDSVFRGNTFVEIAATARAFPLRFAIIAPSSPRHGRTCNDGLLHVRDLTGRSLMSLRPNLRSVGLYPTWLASSNNPARLEAAMRIALEADAPAVFCEAASDDDLAAVVHAARALAQPLLWIGSSGLAHALAASLHPSVSPRPVLDPPRGTLLLFTGSDHPVTTHQLSHLRDYTHPAKVIRVERGRTTDDEIRVAIRTISPATTGALVMNGGDTALQVCRALHITAIHLSGEFAPGIPIGIASGGPFNGCTTILKSGGFGDVDLLSRIAHHCSNSKDRPA